MIDDFSPMYVGDTLPVFAPVFLHKDGTAMDLTGATITMKMAEQGDNTVKVCGGTWTIDDTINGKAHYAWQTADTNTAGDWLLYVTVTIGGAAQHADPKTLEIKFLP